MCMERPPNASKVYEKTRKNSKQIVTIAEQRDCERILRLKQRQLKFLGLSQLTLHSMELKVYLLLGSIQTKMI
jgi:hypothetical protein